MKNPSAAPALALAFACALASLPLAAGTASAGWLTTTVDTNDINNVGRYSSIAVDASGRLHIAYQKVFDAGATDRAIMYATWDGSAWQKTVISNGGENSKSVIAVDGNGYPHVCYFKDAPEWDASAQYFYTYWNGSAWSTPYLIPVPPPRGGDNYSPGWGDVSLAVDKTTGVAHVSMHLSIWQGEALGYWRSGMTASQVVDFGDYGTGAWRTGNRSAIALDGAGNPHISYQDSIGNPEGEDQDFVKHAAWTGSAWAIDTVGELGAYAVPTGEARTAIAVDRSGNPHILYYGKTAQYRYARWTGTSWKTVSPTPMGGPLAGEFASLVLDRNDVPHVVLQVGSYDLLYATIKSGVWTRSILSTTSGDSCSIAVDNGNNVHISYCDGFRLDTLKYVSNARTWLASPSGGQRVAAGAVVPTSWVAPRTAAKFKLSYSLDNRRTWKAITPNYVTGRSHPWTTPALKKTSAACFVKVSGFTAANKPVGSDVSDKSFTIANVTFTAPLAGELLAGGDPYLITWATHALPRTPASVVLSYTVDGGLSWKPLGTAAGDAGDHQWDAVPAVAAVKSRCRIKLVFKDSLGRIVATASGPNFTITP